MFKNLDLECFPSITSRSNDIGYEIKNDMYIKPFVKGATVAAILIWFGPVQTACGMIYPKNRTAVTDIIIAR